MRYLVFTILTLIHINLKAQHGLMTSNPNRMAGDSSSLRFQIEEAKMNNSEARLVVFHSYGIHSCVTKIDNCLMEFSLPKELTQHSAELGLKLFVRSKVVINSSIKIVADTTSKPSVEAYSGPKQILCGSEDFTAMISTTLDIHDNPWPTGTTTQFDYIFKDNIKKVFKASSSIYAYQRFYSGNQSGTALLSVQSEGGTHKAFELTLYPNFPQDFKMTADRDHSFADGKQVTKIRTSIITDRFGNIVADGTMVRYDIYDQNGLFQRGNAPTINGVATMKIPAPVLPMTWEVKGYISKFAKSESIKIKYKKAIASFTARWINSNKLKTSPIRSFLGQLAPDHTAVEIALYQSGKKYKAMKVFTKNGLAEADLSILNPEPCDYMVRVSCGGEYYELAFENHDQK